MNFGIIAAGEGSRLAQEGVALPKPLVRIQGRPMILRLIEIFTGCGAKSISVIVNEQMREVRSFLEDFATKSPVPFNLVIKSTPSSMHSFHELASQFKGRGRFVLTTVDTIFHEDDFRAYVRKFEEAPASVDAMMALTRFVDDEKPLYVSTRPDMRITGFHDKAEAGADFVSGGIYGLSEKCVDVLENCMSQGVSRMRNYQRALIEAGLEVYGYDMGKIIDVDHAGDIEKADKFLENK